jgi:hypothetical protein
MTNPSVTISGFEIAWDLEAGLNLWAGVPTLSMWIPSSVAGMMSAMVAMVGVERFNLCMQLGGQQSIDGDWAMLGEGQTGIRAAVAQTMVSMGLDLSAIATLRDLQQGLTACMPRARPRA